VQARLNVNNDAALRRCELYHTADAIATYTLETYGVAVGDQREFATVEIAAGQATQIDVFTSTASATAQVVLAGFTEGPRT
jgi:hypothetical protein